MRALTIEELQLVAGGYNGSGTVSTVTITPGHHSSSSWYGGGGDNDDGGAYGGSGGGGGGSGGPNNAAGQEELTAPPTPCVNEIPTLPSGVTLDNVNGQAKYIASQIALEPNQHHEYGALIYTVNGQLYHTEIQESTSEDNLSMTFSLPSNAHVVGWIHSHPEDSVMHEGTLSQEPGQDYDRIQDMIAARPEMFDANLLAYVVDMSTNKTYVYDKSERDDTTTHCDLGG